MNEPKNMRERFIKLTDRFNMNWKEQEYLVESLIENGAILPNCKVGDCVYAKSESTKEIESWIVGAVTHLGSESFEYVAVLEDEDGYEKETITFMNIDIGLTVFFNRDQAVQKMKKSGEDDAE